MFAAKPYNLDCHGGAMRMYHCAPENIYRILVARKTESKIATVHELSAEVSSKEPGRKIVLVKLTFRR